LSPILAVYRSIKNGTIPGVKLVHYIKVRRENLEEFLEKRRQPQQFETLRRECRDARQAPLAAAILSSRVGTPRKLEAVSHPTAFI
jgi:hypothetical protein